MTRQKQLLGFPQAPVITDSDRRASMAVIWRQVIVLALIAALWFVIGLTLSLSLIHPKYSEVASGILIAAVLLSVLLSVWVLRRDAVPMPAYAKDLPCAAEDTGASDEYTDDDVIALISPTLFKRPKKLSLPE